MARKKAPQEDEAMYEITRPCTAGGEHCDIGDVVRLSKREGDELCTIKKAKTSKAKRPRKAAKADAPNPDEDTEDDDNEDDDDGGDAGGDGDKS